MYTISTFYIKSDVAQSTFFMKSSVMKYLRFCKIFLRLIACQNSWKKIISEKVLIERMIMNKIIIWPRNTKALKMLKCWKYKLEYYF